MKPELNAETRRTRRSAEKNCFSPAFLCVLRASALKKIVYENAA